MVLLVNSFNTTNNNNSAGISAGNSNGNANSNNNNNNSTTTAVFQGLVLITKVNFLLHLMFVLEFAAAGEQHIGLTEFFHAVVNNLSDKDTINSAIILAALEKILAEGFAEEQDDKTYKLTEAGHSHFGDHGPVSEAKIKKVKSLCPLPPPLNNIKNKLSQLI